jgi:hypothetical protein
MRSAQQENDAMDGTPLSATAPASLVPLETNGKFCRLGTASQLKLHSRWWGVRDHIITALEGSDEESLQKRAQRLDGCCASPLVHRSTDGKATLILQACRDRLCPRCQRARGQETSRRIASLISGWSSCRFATLTLRHSGGTLGQELDRLGEAFRKIRKEPKWKERVVSGVWSIEVTRNVTTKRWHAHLHLLFQGEYFDQALLSRMWEAATGDSPVVDIRAVNDREKTACYIADYVSKPLDAERWSHEDLREYAAAMHGRRLVHTFGRAHGAHIDQAAESEEKIDSEFVAPLRPLLLAADNGDREACHAREIVCRMSRTYCEAAGVRPCPSMAITPPVEEWEHAIVLREASRCFVEYLERMEGKKTVAASPRREPRAEQLQMYDGPRTL